MIAEMSATSIGFVRDLADFLVSEPIFPFVGLFLVVVAFGLFKAVIDR